MTLRSTEVSWLSTESGFGPTQRFNESGLIFANRPTSLLLLSGWPRREGRAVTMVVSATALSWHGIMLSEAASLAPPGRVVR